MLYWAIGITALALIMLLVSYKRSKSTGDGEMHFIGIFGFAKFIWGGILYLLFGDEESEKLQNLVHIMVYVFGTFIFILGIFILANTYPVLDKFASVVLAKIHLEDIQLIVTVLGVVFTLLIVVGTITSEFLTMANLDDRENNKPKKPEKPEMPNTLRMTKEQREKALNAHNEKVKNHQYEMEEYRRALEKWKTASHSRRISILNKVVAFCLFCLLAYINYEGFHMAEISNNVKEADVVKISEDYEINEISESIKRKQKEYDNFINLHNSEIDNANLVVKRQNPAILGMGGVEKLKKQEAEHRKQAEKYLAQANKVKSQIAHLDSRKLDQKERLSAKNQNEINRYASELQSAFRWSMLKTVGLDLSLFVCIFLFVKYRNKSMLIELSHSEHSVSSGSDNTRITTGNKERNITIGDSKINEERKGITSNTESATTALTFGFSDLISKISKGFKSEKAEISGNETEISKPKSEVKSEISPDISPNISKEEVADEEEAPTMSAQEKTEKLKYIAKKIQLPKRYYPMDSADKLKLLKAAAGINYGYSSQDEMWRDFESRYDREIFVYGSAGRDLSDMKKIYRSLEVKEQTSIFSTLKSL